LGERRGTPWTGRQSITGPTENQVVKTAKNVAEAYQWGRRLRDRKHPPLHTCITPTSTQLCNPKPEVQNMQHTGKSCRRQKSPDRHHRELSLRNKKTLCKNGYNREPLQATDQHQTLWGLTAKERPPANSETEIKLKEM